jgi:hypothetical protein
VLSQIISDLLKVILEHDDEVPSWEWKSTKMLPFITVLIKHALSVINDTEYEEDVDASASEEDEDEDEDSFLDRNYLRTPTEHSDEDDSPTDSP